MFFDFVLLSFFSICIFAMFRAALSKMCFKNENYKNVFLPENSTLDKLTFYSVVSTSFI